MSEQVNRGYFEFQYPFTEQKGLSKHPTSIIFLALSSFSILSPPMQDYVLHSLVSAFR